MGSSYSTIFVKVSDHSVDSIGVYMVGSSCIKFDSSINIDPNINKQTLLDATLDTIKDTIIDIHKKSNNTIKFDNIAIFFPNNAFKFVNKQYDINLASEEKITDSMIYNAQREIMTELHRNDISICDFKITRYIVDDVITMNPIGMSANNVTIHSMAIYLNTEFSIMANKISDTTGIKIDKIMPYQMSLYHSMKNGLHHSKKSIIINIDRYKSDIIIANKNDILTIGSLNIGYDTIYNDISGKMSLSHEDISAMIGFASMRYNPSSYKFNLEKFTSLLKSSSSSLLNKIMLYIAKTSGKINNNVGVFVTCDKMDIYSLSQIVSANSEYRFCPINNQDKMQNTLKYYIFSKNSDFDLDKYRKNINSIAVVSFVRTAVNRIYTFLFTL